MQLARLAFSYRAKFPSAVFSTSAVLWTHQRWEKSTLFLVLLAPLSRKVCAETHASWNQRLVTLTPLRYGDSDPQPAAHSALWGRFQTTRKVQQSIRFNTWTEDKQRAKRAVFCSSSAFILDNHAKSGMTSKDLKMGLILEPLNGIEHVVVLFCFFNSLTFAKCFYWLSAHRLYFSTQLFTQKCVFLTCRHLFQKKKKKSLIRQARTFCLNVLFSIESCTRCDRLRSWVFKGGVCGL